MSKPKLLNVTGRWEEESETFDVIISTGTWDEDENDDGIFFYTDGDEINVGDRLAGGFIVEEVNE